MLGRGLTMAACVVRSAQRSLTTFPQPGERLVSLRRLMETQEVVRVLEVHNGLSALIAEHATATRPDGTQATFDAMWSSSLTASASKGKPDIETVTTSERLQLVQDSLDASGKPLIYDGDTGGHPEIFHFTVRALERMGVSACIIEDKTGLKQNSLFGTERKQQLEDIDAFSEKIRAGQAAKLTEEFMIVARLEALIAGWGEEEALKRARAFIDAGADAIMIHSKDKSPDEVLSFLAAYSKFDRKVPVVTVPTTYNTITEAELVAAGSQIVIYANHMLRAAYPSMMGVAESILMHGRSKEADDTVMPVKNIITLIDDNTGMGATEAAAAARGAGGATGGGGVRAFSTSAHARPGARSFSSSAVSHSDVSPFSETVRDFLDPATFFDMLLENDISFFTGVPDSLLKDFCAYVSDHAPSHPGVEHEITANEGSAIALAAGYNMATGKVPLVYMQNSGLGNAVNPLLSLADPQVYSTPMMMLIGWRGEPGKKDEPQHIVQGERMAAMLAAMNIPFEVLPDYEDGARNTVSSLARIATERQCPVALLCRRQTFTKYSMQEPVVSTAPMTREDALRLCLSRLGPWDLVVSTTGFASREVFELREELGQGHERDFLTVGSMGHASAIALGIAKAKPSKDMYCFDGDGAMLMHMGNMATVGMSGLANFKHVINNNFAHDSVGAQPTGTAAIDVPAMARALGYTWAASAETEKEAAELFSELREHKDGPGLLEIRVRPGARSNLGRPTSSPVENKEQFMSFVRT